MHKVQQQCTHNVRSCNVIITQCTFCCDLLSITCAIRVSFRLFVRVEISLDMLPCPTVCISCCSTMSISFYCVSSCPTASISSCSTMSFVTSICYSVYFISYISLYYLVSSICLYYLISSITSSHSFAYTTLHGPSPSNCCVYPVSPFLSAISSCNIT